MKNVILVIFYFHLVVDSFSQIQFTEKKISFTFNGTKHEPGYYFDALYPQFADTSAFFIKLNDSISKLCQITVDTFEYQQRIYEAEDDTSHEYDNYNTYPEEENNDYTIRFNKNNFLSFEIVKTWHAGGGGTGGSALIYCFNIDVKKKEFLNFDSFFKKEKINAVSDLCDKKLTEQANIDAPDTTKYLSSYFSDILFTDKSMIAVYYWYPSGSKFYFATAEIPLEELIQYFISEKKKLFFTKK